MEEQKYGLSGSSQTRAVQTLILAAGLSSRMGQFKPLLPLRGKTVLENTADSALDGGADALTVVVGFRGEEVSGLLRRRYGDRLTVVQNPEYAVTDMLCSIQLGLNAMPPCAAFFLLPGDMPAVCPETFRRLRGIWERDACLVVFPIVDGRRQHPPLVDARLIPEIRSFQGEDGLRGFWRRHEVALQTAVVDDEGTRIDLDTPADYQHCRKLLGG